MPKITSKRTHRLHLFLTETEMQKARSFANKHKTSISEVLRICLNLITNEENTFTFENGLEKEKEKTPKPLNLEF
jgi:hypothetical protein